MQPGRLLGVELVFPGKPHDGKCRAEG